MTIDENRASEAEATAAINARLPPTELWIDGTKATAIEVDGISYRIAACGYETPNWPEPHHKATVQVRKIGVFYDMDGANYFTSFLENQRNSGTWLRDGLELPAEVMAAVAAYGETHRAR